MQDMQGPYESSLQQTRIDLATYIVVGPNEPTDFFCCNLKEKHANNFTLLNVSNTGQ